MGQYDANAIFNGKKSGYANLAPLNHVDSKGNVTRPLKDYEYFLLLGAKAEEMDKANPFPNVPTNYGSYDRDTVNVAKQVLQAKREGMSDRELELFVASCIDITSK